jgi:uncharacterized protein
MTIKYLDAARQGREKWWQYAIGLLVPWTVIFLVTFAVIILLLIFGIINISDFKPPASSTSLIKKIPMWGIYVLSISGISLMCLSILVWIEQAHKRNPLSVICPDPNQTFNFQRCFNAFIGWFSLSLPLSIRLFYTHSSIPQAVEIVSDPLSWLTYLIPTVFLVFISALFSEIVRGYVLQGIGLAVKKKYILVSISALLLTSMAVFANLKQPQHLLIQSAIGVFIFGVGFAMVILKDNGLELALGIQIASGLISKFISYKSSEDSVLPPAMISIDKNTPLFSSAVSIGIVVLCIKLAIFYAVFLRKSSPITQD